MTFLDTVLTLSNAAVVLPLLVLLLWKRTFQTLPIFVAYQAYTFLETCLYVIVGYRSPGLLIESWIVFYILDTLLYLWVLVELARSVLRFNNRVLPPLVVFVPLSALASALIWPLTRWSFAGGLKFAWQIGYRIMRTSAILEVSVVLTLILWSNLKKLRWPERELRIVTGMVCWTFIQLCAVILHSDGLTGTRYHWVDLLTPLSVLFVGLYWLHYFWLEPRGQSTRIGAHRLDQALRSDSRQDQKVLHKYALENRQAQRSS